MPRFCALAVAALILLAPAAWAAEGYNAHLLNPALFAGRYLTFEDTQTMPQWRWAAGALLGYAHMPVEARTDNDRTSGIMDNLLTVDLFGGISVHDMVNVGLGIPVHVYDRGRSFDDLGDADGATSRENSAALGDLRLAAKVRLLEEGIWPMGFAVTPFVTLPTGAADRLLGEGRLTTGVTATYEIDLAWLRMALHGGWRYRGRSGVLDTQVRNSFPLAAGFSRDLTKKWNVSLELHGESYESENNRRFAGNPFELDLIGRYQFTRDWRIIGGGGPGLTSGVGSPDFRVFAGVDYRPKRVAAPPPSTGDLRVVAQNAEGQLLEAEVGLEGPELRIGNTVNGRLTMTDLAPGTYRVRVSRPDYETGMGEVNVNAGRIAALTIVLQRPETRLIIIVLDDHSGQRIPGSIVFWPGQAGEATAPNPSGEYSSPTQPGPVCFTAAAEDHESVMTTVQVEPNRVTTITVRLRKKIAKKGRIFFDLNSAELRTESHAVLDDVAVKIKEMQAKKVIIEGHCSDEGSDEYNLDLSRQRAQTVRDYLVARGVDTQILEIQAFGESRPIAANESEEGRERNRRVEFIIVEE